MGNSIILYLYIADSVVFLGKIFWFFCAIGWVSLLAFLFFYWMHTDCNDWKDESHKKRWWKNIKSVFITLLIATPLLSFIPSKELMYTALGIKGIESVVESNGFKSITGKTLDLVNKKLDEQLDGE